MTTCANVFVGRVTIERWRRVELSQRDLREWASGCVDQRNAGAVILDDDRSILLQEHVDPTAPPGKVLVQ
ncbi:Hypothetical protein A7982_01098 [Minicystis rosea]|nr:Hypothetical protein A7982_01098 [Minicystis rosea]